MVRSSRTQIYATVLLPILNPQIPKAREEATDGQCEDVPSESSAHDKEDEARYLHKVDHSTATSLTQGSRSDRTTGGTQDVSRKRYDCNNVGDFDFAGNLHYTRYIKNRCKGVRLRVIKPLMSIFLNSQKSFILAMQSPVGNRMVVFLLKITNCEVPSGRGFNRHG